MIAAFDVHYFGDGSASAAAVLFHDYKDAVPAAEHTRIVRDVADYLPGHFYRRELPCILALLALFGKAPDEMVIDGYVMLGDRPGLGQHLFESLHCTVPVIGVAKSKFRGSSGAEVLRGRSAKPLYVTSAGMDIRKASEKIQTMYGPHRVPDLLRYVDHLARMKTKQPFYP
ncbi:MAG: Endonuclease V [Syntrophorhabdus sp. PtaU1.Bin058]|nr:MAG: Endonuclease V [Syntrophorhabdus sp. PtaU1.Bin058]